MRVALGGAKIDVPEELLHHVQRNLSIDQKTCKGMAQVMQSQSLQAGPPFDPAPGKMQRRRRSAGDRRGKDVRVPGRALQRLQQGYRGAGKRNHPRPTGLRNRDEQGLAPPVDVIPFGVGNLVTAGARQQEQQDGIGSDPVLICFERGDERRLSQSGRSAVLQEEEKRESATMIHPSANCA